MGPVWQGGDRGEDEALAACYRRSLALAGDHALRSIAFSAISTGVYGFPAARAARIAVTTTIGANPSESGIARVIFCCFSSASADWHRQALSNIASF